MASRKKIIQNPVGDSERYYDSSGPLGSKEGGRTKTTTLRKDEGRKGTLSTVSKYPDLLDVYSLINSVNKEQIRRYSKTEDIAILSRDILFAFANDWGELNRDHSGYLSQVPENYDSFNAAIIGDLLYWMITGVNERSKLKSGTQIKDAHAWTLEIRKNCPDFSKRMDTMAGLTIHDLRGLQIRLLNNLPINSYNRYTVAQMTQDDPEISEQIYPSIEPLTSVEHQSLITLKALVTEGDIMKFSVALAQAQDDRGEDFENASAGRTFEAFELAKSTVGSYQRGEIEEARMRLRSLNGEYGLNMNTFQSGLKDMFVITASTLDFKGNRTANRAIVRNSRSRNNKNNNNNAQRDSKNTYLKGSPSPLLVSLDTSMPPFKTGWKKSNMHAAMKAANQTNIEMTYDKVAKIVKMKLASKENNGTLGLTAAVYGSENKSLALTTNWSGLFEAAISGRDVKSKEGLKELSEGIALNWPKETISIRFIIHADLSKGIGEDYLVPKGRLTVVARPSDDGYSVGDFGKLDKFGNNIFLPKIDLFVEDLGRGSDISDAYTDASRSKGLEEIDELGDNDLATALEDNLGQKTLRANVKKNPSVRGKAIAIDLVPRSQINMKTLTETNKNLKYIKKVRDQLGLNDLYKHYATGQEPVYNKKNKTYRWKGKVYNTKAQVMDTVMKTGTQVDKGNPKIQIIYGKRKDNNNLVPHRIILPRMIIQHDLATGKISAKKGSKYSKETSLLLKRIEQDFGEIKLKKTLTDGGGQIFKDAVLKSKDINYNRGVSKLFESTGLKYDKIVCYVSQVGLNGVMQYEGRRPGGQRVGPFSLAPSKGGIANE